jgi:hypothetical protein
MKGIKPGEEYFLFYVTGTYNGAHIHCKTEGIARAIFHNKYEGETITHIIGIKTNHKKVLLQNSYK